MKKAATGSTGPPGPGQHLLGPVEDELPVGQSGQGVVEGPVGQEGLELLALGDVADVDHVAVHRGPVQLVGHHGLDVPPAAVLASHPELHEHVVGRVPDWSSGPAP